MHVQTKPYGAELHERVIAQNLQKIEKEQCSLCLLNKNFGTCSVMSAMEEEQGSTIYDAICEDGKSKVKQHIDNLPDRVIGDYYLLRHWDE